MIVFSGLWMTDLYPLPGMVHRARHFHRFLGSFFPWRPLLSLWQETSFLLFPKKVLPYTQKLSVWKFFIYVREQSCCYVSCQILHKKFCSLFQNICLLDNDSFRARERQKQGDVPADDLLSKWLWWRALANLKPGASSSSSTWGQGPNIWVIFNYFSQTNSHKLDQKRSTQDTNMHLYV